MTIIPVQKKNEYEDRQFAHCLDSTLADREKFLAEFESSISSLPRVEPDGTSECPFAESLYRKKRDLHKKIAFFVAATRGDLGIVDRERARLTRNWKILADCASGVQNAFPKNELLHGEEACRERLKKTSQQKRALLDLIHRMEEALARSATKQHPGLKTEEEESDERAPSLNATVSVPPAPAVTGESRELPRPAPLDKGREMQRELDELIALGPIRTGKGGHRGS